MEAGYAEHLSTRGDNVAQVAQYLFQNHPECFDRVLQVMSARVPGVSGVEAKPTEDGRLVLRFQTLRRGEPGSLVLLPTGPGTPIVVENTTIVEFYTASFVSDENEVVFAGSEEGAPLALVSPDGTERRAAADHRRSASGPSQCQSRHEAGVSGWLDACRGQRRGNRALSSRRRRAARLR